MSEDSDSDHANFEQPTKVGSNVIIQKANTFSNNEAMESSTRNSEQVSSDNLSKTSSEKEILSQGIEVPKISKTSKSSAFGAVSDQPISKSPILKAIPQTTENKRASESSRHLSQTTERGASSSDSTSNSDTSDSESSSDEEDNVKDNSNKKQRASEFPVITNSSPKTDVSHANKTPNEEPRLSSISARNVMSCTSPFDQNSTNITSFDPISNNGNLSTSEQEPENVENEEVYGLDFYYKKVIKSTHSPHSQPSPKISQVNENIHINLHQVKYVALIHRNNFDLL